MEKVDDLEQAIERSKDLIKSLEERGYKAGGERQLLSWLEELQNYREEMQKLFDEIKEEIKRIRDVQNLTFVDEKKHYYQKGIGKGLSLALQMVKKHVNSKSKMNIFSSIQEEILDYVCNKEENTEKAQGMLNALKIVEKHMESKGV